jgi:hypothetical protein
MGRCQVTASNPHAALGDYHPASNVIEHSQITEDIAALNLAIGLNDFARAKEIYAEGQNSCKSTVQTRTLHGFVKESTATGKLVGEAFFDSFTGGDGPDAAHGPIPGTGRLNLAVTFWDDFMIGALDGTGDFAGMSDAMRAVAVKKGALGVLTMYANYELESAIGKAVGGSTADTEAPHAWDEGWAFYFGSLDDGVASAWEFAKKRDLDYAYESGSTDPVGLVVTDVIDDFYKHGLKYSRGTTGFTVDVDEMIAARNNIYMGQALTAIRAGLKYAHKMQNPYSDEYHMEAYAYFLSAAGWIEQAHPGAASAVLALLDYTLAEADLDANVYCAVREALIPAYASLGLDCDDVGVWKDLPDTPATICPDEVDACPTEQSTLPIGLATYEPDTDTTAGSNVACDPYATIPAVRSAAPRWSVYGCFLAVVASAMGA